MTSLLTREQILAADDLKTERVPVPEWGGDVLVKMMNGTELDAYEATVYRDGKDQAIDNKRAKLIARCACDESGKLLFTAADVEAIGRKSAPILERIAKVVQRLNKMTDADLEELKGN